jgi:ribosomal protein L19
MNAVAFVHEQLTAKKEVPKFKAGDNVTVNYKIIEGNKERIQSFKGDVINARDKVLPQLLLFVKFLITLVLKDYFL